jgi:ferredoxin-NADP reductase/DMSO/TMAO reductase YedYZ heme-binding membrane subunit
MLNTRFSRGLLAFNAGIPLALVAWDAWHHQLGADPINEAIHTTGWLALFFLTLSLAVTPLRRLSGLDWLVSFRRTLGVYGFAYAATHFSIYFWLDRAHSVRSTVAEILGKPFITFGACALLLLTPLAITSTNGMISRLGQPRWKWLHTLVYPATALAALHYWLEGKLVTFDKKVFAACVVGLLLFRWIARLASPEKKAAAKLPAKARAPLETDGAPTPLRKKPWRGQLKVARISRETPSVQTFRLVAVDGGALPFSHLPGQYLSLSLDIAGKKVPRSYTIASAPTQRDFCELTIKREELGLASRHLHDTLREGDLLQVTAPAGKFTFTGTEAPGVILIAGGVGITPLMSIARALTDRSWGGEIDLFYSVRSERELIFAVEIARLAKSFPNFKPHLSVTGEASAVWTGLRSRIDAALIRRFVPDLSQRIAFVCGPTPMLEPMRAMLRELGVPDAQVRFEEFTSKGRSATGNEPAPAADASGDATDIGAANDDVGAAAATIAFAKSGLSARPGADQTVLEAAEEAGVEIPSDCRAGTCGTCKTKLLSGRVRMESEDALTRSDKKLGLILACQAHAAGDITVDA